MKNAMTSKSTLSLMMSFMLSLLLITAAQPNLYAQAAAPAYVELDAVQLDQLVAPIALDPDSLVAQILTASTYPDQVSEADTWLNQHMNQPPDQRAAGANNMSWDPAVKGLIEFPSELDTLAKNTAWTSQLGNAYYNQPGDVMNAVQAMRLQAQQSNVLVTTVQQRVVVEAGLIEIVPVNPAVIYVPYYNPWHIWGTLFVAYPGFVELPPPAGIVWASGIAFDPGIAVGVYAGYGWGFGAWAPAWDGGTVLFNNSTYISNSVTVANHGYFGGHDRGAFEHGGRGVPHGYQAHAHAGDARTHAGRANAGRGNFGKPSAGHAAAGHGAAGNRSAYGNRGTGHQGTTSASRGSANANRGRATASRVSSSNRGTQSASRGSANRNGSMANRGASANRGTQTASRGASSSSRGASANRSASANRGAASASRGSSSASRSASANHGASSANRSASASHGASSANRSASANHGAPSANRGGASANRSSANHGGAMANRGGSSASHGSSMASRGGSSAGHSGGGGHASGGKGKGR